MQVSKSLSISLKFQKWVPEAKDYRRTKKKVLRAFTPATYFLHQIFQMLSKNLHHLKKNLHHPGLHRLPLFACLT